MTECVIVWSVKVLNGTILRSSQYSLDKMGKRALQALRDLSAAKRFFQGQFLDGLVGVVAVFVYLNAFTMGFVFWPSVSPCVVPLCSYVLFRSAV